MVTIFFLLAFQTLGSSIWLSDTELCRKNTNKSGYTELCNPVASYPNSPRQPQTHEHHTTTHATTGTPMIGGRQGVQPHNQTRSHDWWRRGVVRSHGRNRILRTKPTAPHKKQRKQQEGQKTTRKSSQNPLGCLKITWNQTIVTTFLITHIAGPQKLDASKRLHESTVALTSVSHTKIMHQHRKRLQGIAFRLKAWHAHHQPKSKCWCWQHARLPGCLEGSKR